MKKILLPLLAFALLASCGTKQKAPQKLPPPVVKLDTVPIEKISEPPLYRASAAKENDLVHTRLEVKFDWSKKHLLGKAYITAKPHWYPSDRIILDAKGFDINEVSLVLDKDKKKLQYEYRNDSLTIHLDKTYTRDDKYTVFVDYVSKPDERETKGSAAITSDKGLYFINADGKVKNKPRQIWTQGETESNSTWFPTIDKPNQKMTQEIYITIEKNFVTLSNGLLIYSMENADGTRTDYWKQDLPAAPYLTMMAIGEFAVVKDKWKNKEGKDIEVNYYVEKDYEPYAKAIFGNTPEMLEFFSTRLGVGYAWEKFSQVVVRDYVSGAMENTSAVLHGDFLQKTDRELLDGSGEDVVSHELFHHWFGDLVTCESWSNIPLNESFATYGEYLWDEYKYGREEADHHSQSSMNGYLSSAAQGGDETLIRFEYDDKEDMFDAISYNKGGRVLHMLRKCVGDDAFFASLKLYLSRNKFKSVEVHDLRLAFEEVTGQDLNWFFNQWFMQAGHPVLNIRHAYSDSTRKYTVTIKQTQDLKKNPLYKLPMEVDIYANGNKTRKHIVMTRSEQSFDFDCPSKPDLVNVDAEKMLLCSKTEKKSVNEWIFQYKNCPLYLDRFEALTELGRKAKEPGVAETIISALGDKFWSLRQSAIKKLDAILADNRDAIRKKLIDLAQNDPKADVRADALSFLSKNYKDDDLTQLFEKATSDRSYNVMGDALMALAKTDPKKAMSIAKPYENEKSKALLVNIASLYSQYGADENNPFFVNAAPKFSGFDNIPFCNYYVSFLKKFGSDESINSSIPIFENIARNEGKWIKYFGKKAISDLYGLYSDREEASQNKINEMKSLDPNAAGVKTEQDRLEKIRAQKQKFAALNKEIESLK